MLQIRNLNLSMKKDLRQLLKGFTFSLNPGDKAAIIGEEGNGKSTLLKLLYDETLVEDYAEWNGTVQKDGMVLGYLPQEAAKEDGKKTVYGFCCEEPAFLESSLKEIANTAAKLRLSPDMFYSDRKLSTLSGGEKVKLRMALLTFRRPDCWLLDEPSNDLDIETLEWLESFIQSCSQPMLFISHDETLLENTANVIIHLEQLRRKTLPRHTVAKMGYRQYVEERLQGFAHQEQMARKEREEDKKRQEKIMRMEQKVQHRLDSISHAERDHAGQLLKKKMKSVKSMEHRFDRERAEMTELPEAEDAILAGFDEGVSLPAGKTVLDFSLAQLEAGGEILAENIRLYVKGPERVCIFGKNGAGKTSLLRRIARELLDRPDIKAAYMPQDYTETVDQTLTPAEYLAPSGRKGDVTRAKTYLGSMKYTVEECGHSIARLSGGQKAKLFFLKMILDGNNVLILDEPTRNFSPLSGPVIRGMLKAFGGCIISVSHDRKYIKEVCDVFYELTAGGLRKA